MPTPSPERPWRARNTLIAAGAYVLGGLFSVSAGLIVSGPSGQASVVWLPPGIALAALLIGGRRVWLGIGLGALVIDVVLGLAEAPNASPAYHATLALVLSAASVLQMLVNGVLVQRFAGRPLTLTVPRDVMAFLACGAAASLIMPTVGSSLLVAFGTRKLATLPLDWASWWISDTVSVFLVTPVVLAWSARPAHVWRPRRLQLTLPLCLMLSLVATVFAQATKLDGARARSDFELEAGAVGVQLTRAVDTALEATHALKDLFDASLRVEQAEFLGFSSHLRARHAALAGSRWIPFVSGDARDEHEQSARRGGDPEYAIRELDRDGQLVRAASRDHYLPLRFEEPASPGGGLVGLDFGSLPGRSALLQQAGRAAKLVVSPTVKLMRESGGPLGVLVVLPVHGHPAGAAARPLRGFTLSIVRYESLMRDVMQHVRADFLHVSLHDDARARAPLFESTGPRVSPARLPFSWDHRLRRGGHTWILHVEPTQRYLDAHRSWTSSTVSLAGLAFSALLCGFLLITTGHSASIGMLVRERTAALERSERRWQFALEEAGDGMWDWDVQGNQLYWSPKTWHILGYDDGELGLGAEKWSRLAHPDDLARMRPHLDEHFAGKIPTYCAEVRMLRKDGTWTWVSTHAKVVERDQRGTPLRIIGTLACVDDRKRTEDELKAHRDHLEVMVHARTAELETAKAVAENANRAKSVFLANMSHELRTPMHAVLAYARLAADRSSDAKLKDFMTRIVSSGERLLALLNDLLDLSKLEAGRTTPQLADADLSLLIAEVTRELEPLLAGKQLSLEISRDAGCVEDVMAAIDRRQMAQVFHNVLSNAVKFSPERGRLSVRIACAELPAVPGAVDQMRAPALQVAFSDQGVGIPEQELETVFDSFVQSTKTRTNAGGTGLGLAICRQIMDLHGGQITARNNDGPGATFVITVPRAIRRKAQAGAAA